MAANRRIETDPLGHRVALDKLQPPADSAEPEEVLAQVIRRPAMLIEINGSSHPILYFFRSIDWGRTLLIAARLQNEIWEAFSSVENPGSAELSTLLSKGRQLI